MVGIVIPNAGAWLLPEFQDLAEALEHTLDLPTILPHGARVDPTSDGFLLWLPTCELPAFPVVPAGPERATCDPFTSALPALP